MNLKSQGRKRRSKVIPSISVWIAEEVTAACSGKGHPAFGVVGRISELRFYHSEFQVKMGWPCRHVRCMGMAFFREVWAGRRDSGVNSV